MMEILAAVGGLIVGFVAAKFMGGASGNTTDAPQPVASTPPPEPQPSPAPPKPVRNDAITLLTTLQREARFIDIVKEPLADYSDAQVGAAARDVLRDCGTVLDRMFQLEPLVDQEEGTTFEVPASATPGEFRLTGNASGETQSGALVHPGWRATRCELPEWTGDEKAAMVVAPAELEVK